MVLWQLVHMLAVLRQRHCHSHGNVQLMILYSSLPRVYSYGVAETELITQATCLCNFRGFSVDVIDGDCSALPKQTTQSCPGVPCGMGCECRRNARVYMCTCV